MRSPTSPLEQQPTTINLYQGLGFLPEFSTTKQMADEFTNQLFHRLEGCCGMMRSRTTPYHPKGMVKKERLNQTLLSMLRTSPENRKSRWKDSLNQFIQAYYCPCHETTGFSRYYLLCAQFSRLPIHPILELSLLLPQNIQLMSVKMENSHEGGSRVSSK